MKIHIIAVGRLREKYQIEAERHFVSRIAKKAEIIIIEVIPDRTGSAVKDGEELLSKIPEGSKAVMLDTRGKSIDTEGLAAETGTGDTAFVIGGPEGFGDNVYERIHRRISLSAMTYTHQTARLLLLEQIERMLYSG